MPRLQKLIFHPQADKIFLRVLGCVYLVYLVVFASVVNFSRTSPSVSIVEHTVDTNAVTIVSYWKANTMRSATNVDSPVNQPLSLTQGSVDTNAGKAAKKQGQPAENGAVSYPLSTVGKVFFTNSTGQAFVCSGTAVVSDNHSVVDTAGHCLYWQGAWVRNMIFCPLYDNGNTPYGCWAARDLEVPADWINAKPNDFHQDFGMAIVAPNSGGKLTDVVGGMGWAYNQSLDQPFYAYGYPAGYPFDGQTRQSCENQLGTSWQHGGGTVVSIPCNMTGGSSGGPWFIQIGGNWYLNGHNDFISSLKFGHMFSPYYDDTWYDLYSKAQAS